MRVPRICVAGDLAPGREVVLPPEAATHIARVLRLAAGDAVTLFNGDGRDYKGRLQAAARRETRVLIEATGDPEPLPALHLTLAIGISRGERMDFVIQKAVELGVAVIQPLFTERSVVRLDPQRAERRHLHWQGVLTAACEQSGRRRLPALQMPGELDEWLAGTAGARLLLDPQGDRSLPDLPAPDRAATLLVGPEGGLAMVERDRARRAGFLSIRLGPRILRTETAPLAALAAMQVLWGDLR